MKIIDGTIIPSNHYQMTVQDDTLTIDLVN